jgi:hypothetical protein
VREEESSAREEDDKWDPLVGERGRGVSYHFGKGRSWAGAGFRDWAEWLPLGPFPFSDFFFSFSFFYFLSILLQI